MNTVLFLAVSLNTPAHTTITTKLRASDNLSLSFARDIIQ